MSLKKKKSLIYISLIIAFIDILFIVINYYSSKEALNQTLLQKAKTHENEFNLMLKMTFRNMLQISTFISLNKELNQLFLQGKKAIEKEQKDKGGPLASQARQALLDKIKPSWDKMTTEFNVRQLHYQLGPGSLSFLRVHKPDKFGDRMDNLRHIIVDINNDKTARSGLETGRVYSGLRGVSPVWAIDPQNNEKVYVGAIEVGTSFEQLLSLFLETFNVETSILLTKSHVENKMWKEFINEYFAKNPDIDYYLESSSSSATKSILSQISINNDLKTSGVKLIKKNSKHYSTYYFPIFDYQGVQQNKVNPAGLVLMWEDVSNLIYSFRKSLFINVIFSIIGFILIEFGLIWIFKREERLSSAEESANLDGLTALFNRRYYDNALKIELNRAKRNSQPLSIIIIDIDYFKVFNDTYGHQSGDQCLKSIAGALKSQIKRSGEFVARYGGEEFVVVLPHTNLVSAVDIANDIKKSIASLKIPHKNSTVAPFVTISQGVASTEYTEGNNLFETADKNLYKAKESGRNMVEHSIH